MSDDIDSGRRDFLGHGVVAAGAAVVVAAGTHAAAGEAAGHPGAPVCAHNTVSDDELKALIRLAEGLQARPLGWCAYGQPAADTVCGTIEIPKSRIAEFVTRFGAWKPLLPHGVNFPYGIPANDLDRVLISIRAGAGRANER